MTVKQPSETSRRGPATPYSPPEDRNTALGQTVRSRSIIVQVLAVIDFLLGAVIAGAMVDSPWIRNLLSLLLFSATTVTAWGLFRHRVWGWWCGVILHSTVLAGGTLAYAICMLYLVSDFGRPPSHMSLITSEGAAVLLTIVFVVAALLASIPLFVLRTLRCRRCFGVTSFLPSEELRSCRGRMSTGGRD